MANLQCLEKSSLEINGVIIVVMASNFLTLPTSLICVLHELLNSSISLDPAMSQLLVCLPLINIQRQNILNICY